MSSKQINVNNNLHCRF